MAERPLDSGRKDVLGRTVRVSGDVAGSRADAPPPSPVLVVAPTEMGAVEPCPDCGLPMVYVAASDDYLHVNGGGGCFLAGKQREMSLNDHAGAAAVLYAQSVAESDAKRSVLATIDDGEWGEIACEVLENYEGIVDGGVDLDGLVDGGGEFADVVFALREQVRQKVVDAAPLPDGDGDGWVPTHRSLLDGSELRQVGDDRFENENGDVVDVDRSEWERVSPQIVPAGAFEAAKCPSCKQWIFTAGGPFAEGDRTKTLAEAEHWFAEHASEEERSGQTLGIPWFSANTEPVDAVVLPSSSAYRPG